MTSAKDLLMNDKELAGKWRAFVHSNDTARVLVLVWAELFRTHTLSREQIIGAKAFEYAMLNIAEDNPAENPFPDVGLRHNIDDPRSERTATETSKTQTI